MLYDPLERAIQRKCEQSLYFYIQEAFKYADPVPYIDNWHIEDMSTCLMDYQAGRLERKNILFNIPPGMMKSLTVCVFFPSWVWGPLGMPQIRFACTSHKESLALRDAVKARDLMRSDWYQARWQDKFSIRRDRNTASVYVNNHGGHRVSSSVAGIMGEGGDYLIFDDPHNVEVAESDDVLRDNVRKIKLSIPTRVRVKWGGVICIMQRLREFDYSGDVLETARGQWEHFMLPNEYEEEHPHAMDMSNGMIDRRSVPGELLFPDKQDAEDTAALKIPLGDYGYSGQEQQRPTPKTGGLFDTDMLEIVDAAPAGKQMLDVRGWDFAATDNNPDASFTVGLKMRYISSMWYILHIWRKQVRSEKVLTALKIIATQDGNQVIQDLPQDPGSAGKSYVQFLIGQLPGFRVVSSLETGKLRVRSDPAASQINAGNFKLVKGDWNDELIGELRLYDKGSHDDQVSALARAFNRTISGSGTGIESGFTT